MTVLKALREAWPGHSTVYLGDTARVPYGSKSPQTIVRYATQISHYLMQQGIELLVVACNTASAYALTALSEGLTVPVVGVIEPGAQAAVEAAAGRPIAVIGTAGTIASGAYHQAIRQRAPEAVISAAACPLFVPLAEEGWEDSPVTQEVARHYLAPWLPGQPSRPAVLVLGCTHYPVLKPALAQVLGPQVMLIDSAQATARAVAPYLSEAPREADSQHRLIVTDGAPGFEKTAARWLGEDVQLEVVDLSPAAIG